MLNSQTPAMGKWRERLWPVFSDEVKIFLPMVVIMFWVLFNYTTVRNLKDSLLVNAPHSGSFTLPWVKMGLVTPCAIFTVIGYAKLSNVLSRQKLYYSTLFPFAVFFLLFAFVLYPARAYLNASPEWIETTMLAYPKLAPAIPAIGYWLFSLFYLMAELWGNVAVALLFWQFANQITPTSQAKRFYPMYGFYANLGLVAAGVLTGFGDKLFKEVRLPTGEKDFTTQVQVYTGCVVLGCLLIGLMYWWMHKGNVLTEEQKFGSGKKKKEKVKMSLKDSALFLMKSRYLWYIMVLVLAYGITINIVEVLWKESVSLYFIDPTTGKKDPGAYSAFIGKSFIGTGLATMMLILVSKNLLKVGWLFAASLTPWVVMITGAGFFSFMVFQDHLSGFCQVIGSSALEVAVILGLVQNVLSKGTKYSLFDPTKEMAFIVGNEEEKVKGKAAVDVLGGRAGKSGGSVIQIVSQLVTKTISMPQLNVPILGAILVGITFWWLWAVKSLSEDYTKRLQAAEAETGPSSTL